MGTVHDIHEPLYELAQRDVDALAVRFRELAEEVEAIDDLHIALALLTVAAEVYGARYPEHVTGNFAEQAEHVWNLAWTAPGES